MPVRVRGADIESDAFIRCRTYNHAWDEFFPIDMETPWIGWRLSLRCVRCQTERHDVIDFKGAMMQRRYIYPDGYQTPKGEEKKERSVFREELFEKLRDRLEKSHAIVNEPTPITKATRARSRKAAG
jgi:hypothetical protein